MHHRALTLISILGYLFSRAIEIIYYTKFRQILFKRAIHECHCA